MSKQTTTNNADDFLKTYHSPHCRTSTMWFDGQTEPYPCDCGLILAIQHNNNSLLREILEELDNLPDWVQVFDNDTHRYQIPKKKHKDWGEWLEIPEDDERAWEVPSYAVRIDGLPVTTQIEQITATIKSKLRGE